MFQMFLPNAITKVCGILKTNLPANELTFFPLAGSTKTGLSRSRRRRKHMLFDMSLTGTAIRAGIA